MENLNRVLLENVLPAHVAEHFLARSLKNEVGCHGAVGWGGPGGLAMTWRPVALQTRSAPHVHYQPVLVHF